MFKIRKGFTLVELLIVIVIIGILAAAMLLSSGSATDSAEASNIISDLRSLKSAALLLHADSMDDGTYRGLTSLALMQALGKYSDNPGKFTSATALVNGWGVTGNPGDGYVAHRNITALNAGVKTRLQGRAKNVGLVTDSRTTDYDGGNIVGMVMR